MTSRDGRPRRYALTPVRGMSNDELASYLSFIDELRERVVDQIKALPPEVLNHEFAKTHISIARLALHMAWAEYSWMERIAGKKGGLSVRPELRNELVTGSLERFSDAPPKVQRADRVIALYGELRSEITLPVCSAIVSLDEKLEHPALDDPRKVLQHLIWHWTYHSGQIGILAFELDWDYTWRFEDVTV